MDANNRGVRIEYKTIAQHFYSKGDRTVPSATVMPEARP
jgi:hypothetical protein